MADQLKSDKKQTSEKKQKFKKKSTDPYLSLCMIVKNEEDSLPVCLKSIKNVVDEIIIVDTGSTDRTIKIAEQFGAKIYEHPWENDFAKHRNQSISYAKGDWIIILDADEELMSSSRQLISKAIQDINIDSIAVQIINSFKNRETYAMFNSVRLFKNNKKIRYEGIVHNREVGCTRTKFYPIQILHHGYCLNEQKTKEKFKRTATLLEKQITAVPNNPLPHHYLSASYMSIGAYDNAYYVKAIEEGNLAIKLAAEKQDNDQIYIYTHYITAASYLNLGMPHKAKKLCEAALEIFPDHLDSYYLLAKIYDQQNNYQKANDYAERFLTIKNKFEKHPELFGRTMHINISSGWYMNLIKGKNRYVMGFKENAKDIFQDIEAENAEDWNVLKSIGEFYYKICDYDEAATYLNKAMDIKKERISLYMVCECYGQAGKQEEQKNILADIISYYPEEMNNFKQIGLVQFNRGNYMLARFCWEKVVQSGTASQEIIQKLSIAVSKLNANKQARIESVHKKLSHKETKDPLITIIMPVGSNFGWGVCGRYLSMELHKLLQTKLVTEPFKLENIGNKHDYDLLQQMQMEQNLIEKMKNHVCDFTSPVLQAIEGHSLDPWLLRLKSPYTVGYTFFEKDLIPSENIKKANDYYDIIIAGSTWCEEILKQSGCSRTSTVLQGINSDIFHINHAGKTKYKDKFVIFSGGKLEFRKGQDIVIKAFKTLQDKYNDVMLVNAWYNIWDHSVHTMHASPYIQFNMPKKNYINSVNHLLTINGIDPEKVITLPSLPNCDMPEIYRNSDIGLFPNRCEGGTNLVLMEYMACGRPVIASYSTGHKDILTENNSIMINSLKKFKVQSSDKKILFQWDEPDLDEIIAKLEYAYWHREDLNDIGENAGKDLAKLTWSESARRFYEIIKLEK